MQVCGSQVDDDAHARNSVSKGLQGRYGTKQALLHRHVRKPDEMYPNPPFDAHLNGYFHGVYTDALG